MGQMDRLEGWIWQFLKWHENNVEKQKVNGGPCGWASLMFTLFEMKALSFRDVTKFEDILELLLNIRSVIEREQRDDPLIQRLMSINMGSAQVGTLPSGIFNAIRKQRLPCFEGLSAKIYVTKKCLEVYPVFKECADEWKYIVTDDIPQLKPNERALEMVIINSGDQ